MDKLLGFAPDADPSVPGVLISVANLIPYEQGMKGAPTGVTPANVPALAAACKGAIVATKLDATRRVFAGTLTKLYELSAGAWSDVSTGSYTGGTDSRWSFAQFGNSTLASNLSDTIQRSSGAAFSAIAGAPKAKIIFSVGSQIMALNINDGTTKPDGWYCCATFDETDWATSVTTLCAKGQIVAAPGPFNAGGKLGEYAVGYKDKSIHVGQFVGAPAVWDWVQAPGGDAGCIGQDAWADIGGAHFIVGQDNFWIFDGSRPAPIGDDVIRNWFFSNANPNYIYRTQCVCDRQNNVVWVFYCSLTSETPDKAIVYHLKSKMWGAADIAVQATLNYVSAGATIDGLTSIAATIDGLSSFSFDSQFWFVGGRSLAVFNNSHQLQSVTGPSVSSGMTTGDAGDDDMVTLLSSIRLRFLPGYKPASATVQTYTKMEAGDSVSTGSTATMSDGKFDVMDSARWHSASFTFTGEHRVSGISATLTSEGNA